MHGITTTPYMTLDRQQPFWGHKTEALAGDTIYLVHNTTVRSFLLSPSDEVEAGTGRVAVTSPIGKVLLGRHQGDTVQLTTLDGAFDYTILKII